MQTGKTIIRVSLISIILPLTKEFKITEYHKASTRLSSIRDQKEIFVV